MTTYQQGHRPVNRGMERARFIEVRAHAIDRMRRTKGRVRPVHLFLAPSMHGRVRIWAQVEGGPLLSDMEHAAKYIGRVLPKQSLGHIVLTLRKAIEGREVMPCG